MTATSSSENLGAQLLNIFDAADEEQEGLLSHKEVVDLLYATAGTRITSFIDGSFQISMVVVSQ